MSEFVWGVDVATGHLAFAFADLESDDVAVETLIVRTSEREGARLAHILSSVRRYAYQIRGRYPPAVCWVELPAGKFLKPQLYYVTGVIQAALFETLGVPVWTVPSSTWKKATVGVGNATKPQVRAWVDTQRVSADSQDECDAVAISMAGRAFLQARSMDAAA